MPVTTTSTGQRINYIDSAGDGDPLLVLFGFASTSALAPSRWLDLLTAHFRVIRVDHRGVGGSSDPTAPFSIEDMAADAVAVLGAAGVARSHLYGHSMGGMIAQAIARDWSDRVRRVVLEATAPSPAASIATTNSSTNRSTVRFREQFMDDAVVEDRDDEPGITADNAATFFRHFLSPAFLESDESDQVLAEMAAVYVNTRGPSRRTLRWQRQAVMSFDNWLHLGEISAPTLVVHPADDLKPVERSQEFAAGLADGRLHVVPGAGHDVRWEAPDVSATILIDFLSS